MARHNPDSCVEKELFTLSGSFKTEIYRANAKKLKGGLQYMKYHSSVRIYISCVYRYTCMKNN